MGVLLDFRTEVAAALGEATDGTNWTVYPLPVESPQPPCYVLLWSEPWLDEPLTACSHPARLNVRVIGPRVEPDTGIEVLERMVEAAIPKLAAARHPMRVTSSPEPYQINGINYQSAVMALMQTVNVNGGS